jgi:hypothetical protein
MSEFEGLNPDGRLDFQISSVEANYWWRKNAPVGALLNNLMLLFIVVPIALVFKALYLWGLLLFSLMIPYGFLVRHLSVWAVRNHLASNPDAVDDFCDAGIIFRASEPSQ